MSLPATAATRATAVAVATTVTTAVETTITAAITAAVEAATAAAEAATATAAATAEAATTAATAAATGRALFGFVDAQCASIKVPTIKRFDGCLSLRIGPHRHEAEASRTTGLAVGDNLDVNNLAAGGEGFLKRLVSRVEREIAYVQSITHLPFQAAVRLEPMARVPKTYPRSADRHDRQGCSGARCHTPPAP